MVFYISGHGFGHASRVIEVINALHARRPDVQVHIRTKAPRWLFELTTRGPFTLTEAETDVGVVQVDALTPDLESTLDRAEAFYAESSLIEREAAALLACQADLVVADIPPVAFAAAARANVPSIALSNFSWDWIYEDYARALQRSPTLAETLRSWQQPAREVWRLPMYGGFEGMGPIRDLPLVARRSRHAPTATRRTFGWDDGRVVVLVSFGGVSLQGLPVEEVARAGDLLVVTTDDPTTEREPGRPLSQTSSGGVVRLDERGMYEAGWRYEDIVAAVDVVVSKPGFGTVAECVANQTAMLYTSRGRFAEYEALVAAMPRWLRCRFIEREALWDGRWDTAIRQLIEQPAAPECPATDGAEVAAGWLVAALSEA